MDSPNDRVDYLSLSEGDNHGFVAARDVRAVEYVA
jgi:hypothetical protein